MYFDMGILLFIFLKFCFGSVLLTLDTSGSIITISPVDGRILQNSTLEGGYCLDVTILQNDKECWILGLSESKNEIYYFDCKTLVYKKKYPFITDYSFDDFMYEKDEGILYSVMRTFKGSQPDKEIVGELEFPKFLRRHFTTKEIGILTDGVNRNTVFMGSCIDTKNHRIVAGIKLFDNNTRFVYVFNYEKKVLESVTPYKQNAYESKISCLDDGNVTYIYYTSQGTDMYGNYQYQVLKTNALTGNSEKIAAFDKGIDDEYVTGIVSPDGILFYAGTNDPFEDTQKWYVCELEAGSCKNVGDRKWFFSTGNELIWFDQ